MKRFAYPAALFALAELGAGLLIGDFLARGRAETELFLAFRPWLLLPLALFLATRAVRERLTATIAALMLAALSEAMLAAALGGGAPLLLSGVRGVVAGLVLALLLDAAFSIARWIGGRGWRLLGLALGAGLLLLPVTMRLFDTVALPSEPVSQTGKRPPIALLTGLPIIWAESSTYALISRTFDVRIVDSVTPDALSDTVLVAAQPRALSPGELVAIDTWVRSGSRLLALTDPDLRWPSDLPLGDPRRPPRYEALAPLLTHWGLKMTQTGAKVAVRDIAGRRIAFDSPGRFGPAPSCTIRDDALIADCTIGKGRALLIADADLLHDRLWTGNGPTGATRLGRAADNALFIVEAIERLAGRPQDRSHESVSWALGSGPWPIVAGLAPILIVLALALRPRR